MESLYVCLFSNGHIKVGRSTDPHARIAQHTDRVACLGVELVESYHTDCPANGAGRELVLIERCAKASISRYQREWFSGLGFRVVCEWAYEAAHAEVPATDVALDDENPNIFRAIVAMLRSTGLTQSQIAEECRCDQSSISDIATGRTRDPRYSVGAALIRMSRSAIPSPT